MEAPIINFEDTRVAFISKSNQGLKRALWLFRMIKNPALVKIGTGMIQFAMKIGIPVNWIIKPTLYRHFVGGTTLEECQPVVENLNKYGVKAILDYSVEGVQDEASIQETLQETLNSIKNAVGNPGIPFAVFKPSAFALAALFEQSEAGKAPTGELENEYYRFKSRINALCNEAHKLNVRLMIDAEDSWYQHLVDDTVDEMMLRYNKEKAIVFNTLQMYRHDRLDFLKKSIEKARREGYFYGVKFVRGAYMEKERERARDKGYTSPIHVNKAATDTAFDQALAVSLDNIDRLVIFCGSHNENSNQYFASSMIEQGLAMNDDRCWFSQLYGMSDNLSFNLAAAGFNVAKYVPYGPVKSVVPYLSRRAEENTSVAGQTSRELNLIKKELKRRRKHQ
ncbi:MAG: proline dehydrogenase family protein [Lentimicrobium sp.]|jgi:proline dehydrogenase|nr:proline dehydrogenase family protein [Lentimicrobium sp.]